MILWAMGTLPLDCVRMLVMLHEISIAINPKFELLNRFMRKKKIAQHLDDPNN
jgi:hypothetical protein